MANAEHERHTPEPPPGAAVEGEGTRPERDPAQGPESGEEHPPLRRRRWFRWLVWIAVALLILRLVLALAMPFILDGVASLFGLRCSYDRLSLSILGGSLSISDLVVEPRDAAGDPVLSLARGELDLALSSLLVGRVVVRWVELDGVELRVERGSDGRIVRPVEVGASPGDGTAESEPRASGTEEQPQEDGVPEVRELDLRLPFQIDALRVQHVRAHIVDSSVSPPVDTRVDLQLSISDLGATDAFSRVDLWVSSSGVLGSLRVEARGSLGARSLDGDLSVRVRELDLRPLAGYLEPLGIRGGEPPLAFSLRASARARPSGEDLSTVRVDLGLRDIALEAGQDVIASLERAHCIARALGPGRADVSVIDVAGLEARVGRTPSGALRLGSLEYASPEGSVPADRPREIEPASSPERASPGTFPWAVDVLSLRDLSLTFADEGISPSTRLVVAIDDLEVRGLGPNPSAGDLPMRYRLSLRLPDVIENVSIEGESELDPRVDRVTSRLSMRGITLEALRPYLAAAGVRPSFRRGRLSTRGLVSVVREGADRGTLSVQLRDLSLADSEELFTLRRVDLSRIRSGVRGESLRIGEIAVAGSCLDVRRNGAGGLELLGLVLGEPGANPPAATSPGAGPGVAGEAAPTPPIDDSPRPSRSTLVVERVVLAENALRFTDGALEPEVTFQFVDLGLEIGDLRLDSDPTASAPPAWLRARATIDGVVESARVAGLVVPSPRRPHVELHLTADGVSTRPLAPYLRAAGLEPDLERGRVALSAEVDLDLGRDIFADFSLRHVEILGGEKDLASLAALGGRVVRRASGELIVDTLDIEAPRVIIERDPEGALGLPGLRLPPGGGTIPGEESRQQPVAAAPGGTAPEEGVVVGPDPPRPAATGLAWGLNRLRLREATLLWRDRGHSPAVNVDIKLGAEVDDLAVGTRTRTARVRLSAAAPGVVEELVCSGSLDLSTQAARAELELIGAGLRPGPLEAYLPAGARSTLQDGRLSARASASVEQNPEGGAAVELTVSDLLFREGRRPDPALLSVERIHAGLPRLDPAQRIAVEELAITGVELLGRRTAPDTTEWMGLAVTSTPPPGESGASPPRQEEAAATAPGPAGARRGALFRRLRDVHPLITLEKLEVELRRIALLDATAQEAPPLADARLVLTAREPIRLLGESPEGHPPVKLELTGKLEPVAGSVDLLLDLSPFASDPEVALTLDISGLRGRGLTELLAQLSDRIDGSGLDDGRLRSRLVTTLRWPRKGPLDFDLSRGFGFDVSLNDFAFTNSETVLAGLKTLHVEVERLDPSTGDLHVRLVELDGPAGRVERTADGLRILGLLVKLPTGGPEGSGPGALSDGGPAPETPEAADVPAEVPAPATPANTAPQAAQRQPDQEQSDRRPEIRVDRALLSGIDFTFRDSSMDPAFELPLVDLDVAVDDFTTRALREPVPVRFDVLVRGGAVSLPPRLDRNFFRGMLSGAVSAVSGGALGGRGENELRELFDTVTVRGRVTLVPPLSGWTKIGVNALELSGFAGPAARAGISLNDGLLDLSSHLRFDADGSLKAETGITLNSLSLTEPPDGPISRFLNLPAPLDTVIFVLRDESGSIRLPVSFTVPSGGLSFGEISRVATAALARLIRNAIASSPFRIVGTVGDLAGLGQGEERPPEETLSLEFGPGGTVLEAAARERLDEIIERMRSDDELVLSLNHELGRGDLQRAVILSNPSRSACMDLAARLRKRKREALAAREDVVTKLENLLAAGLQRQALETRRRLLSLDRELAMTEDALDSVYGYLRPGAERQSDRRTRSACVAIGEARLEEVRRYLVESDVPDLADRVRLRRARFETPAEAGGGRVVVSLRHQREP